MELRLFYFNITYKCNSRCIFCAADHPILQDNHQMSLEDFEGILEKNRVGVGDRVVVNGGEPTVHEDFFGFLDAIRRRGAYIDLFTNGMRLSDPLFVDELLKRSPMYIRIPLFGGSAQVHDRLTNCPGSFERVTAALDQLVKKMDSRIHLEIKMLLSAATVDENARIFSLCRQRWQRDHVMVSLNPLLISRCVIDQKELFIDRYSALMARSEKLIHDIIDHHWPLSIDLMPYCVFPNEELIALCHKEQVLEETHYSDPTQERRVDEYKGREKCKGCRYIRVCNGFPNSYLRYMGDDEVRPFL